MALAARFGVSAKVLLAYVVLLIAFAAMSLLTFDNLRRARQHVVAQGDLSLVAQNLRFAEERLGLAQRLRGADAERRMGVSISYAVANLEAASESLERVMREPTLAREARDSHTRTLDNMRGTVAKLRATLAKLPALGEKGALEAEVSQRLGGLATDLGVYRHQIQREIDLATGDFEDARRRAERRALLLGAAGVAVAIASAVLMWRTLRPLKVMRVRAREVAAGDYARRIGVRSRDEIGDLAREFDAMAEALEEREQRLIRSERLATVGRVAAQITHEIRNPLASIGLNAELLGDELPPDGDEGRRLLAALSAEVDRLSEITETYLRFVRLPSPKRDREDPAALVEAVLEFARAELALAGVRLELSFAPGLPDVLVDEIQIRQVLLNLVRNAREAMPGGGVLRVTLRPSPGGVELVVADTGSGIPAEHRARIFEPFFSTKERGTGLGLALVHQVVTEHGGHITVEAPSEGGTRFVIVLPAAPAGGVAPPPGVGTAVAPPLSALKGTS